MKGWLRLVFMLLAKYIKQNFREHILSKCPKCKVGRLRSEFLDMDWDKIVYKCDKCNDRFI